MISNLSKVEILSAEINPEIICCTETRITIDINNGEIDLKNYNITRSNSLSRYSGGVVLYTKKNLKVKVLHDEIFGYNNILIVKIFDSNLNGIWFIVYHSPNSAHTEFLNKFDTLCNDFIENNKNIYIVGDFNINMSRNNRNPSYKNKLNQIMNKYYLCQKVKKSTYVTKDSSSIIDLVISDKKNKIIVNVEDRDQVADHKSVYIMKKKSETSKESIFIKDRRMCNKKNLNDVLIRNDLHSINDYDLQRKSKTFDIILKNAVKSLINIKQINVNYCKRWFNDELKQLRKKRNELQIIAQFTNDSFHWQQYRNVRNQYNFKLNKAKNDDIIDTMNKYKKDSKKLWTELKRFMNNDDKKIEEVQFNGIAMNDGKDISNNFNMFFIQSVIQINHSIKNVAYVPTNYDIDCCWSSFKTYDGGMVMDIMKKMKKNVGIDDITVKVLCDIMETSCDIILSIINTSLLNGIFPSCYELMTVIPVRKVKGTILSNEFRPINTIPVMNKLLQTIVKNEFEEYLDNNRIISKCQSGFRQKHSCESALNLIVSTWKKEICDENVIIAVFVDLTRAFETIDKNILLKKLEEYGLRDIVLNWFKSYIKQHKQRVKFNNIYSEIEGVKIGIAQGTPLSSSLFNLYINDCVNKLKFCKIHLFADDAMIYICCKTDELDVAYEKVNYDLNELVNYFNMLKMKVNINKTKYMEIGSRFPDNNNSITLESQTVEKVNEMKYLGIIIDNKLNFDANIQYIIKKIGKKSYFINRMKNKMSTDAKKLLYKSLIVPHIDYCSTILFMANDQQLYEIQKIQNKTMRSILKRDRMASTQQMLKDLDLLNVRQRIVYNTLKLIYKAETRRIPEYLCELFVRVADAQPHFLRSGNHMRRPNLTNAFGQNSVIYNGIVLYNDMKEKFIVNDNLADFKKKLMEYVKQFVK